jgi:drug/metabolite transporter (DMT)-like permease
MATMAVGPSALTTALVALGAALLSALAMIMLRQVGQRENPEAIALHFSLVATVTLGLIALADLRRPGAFDAGCMVLAGVCGGFAQLALTRAYALDRAARVGAIGYLSVVASALLGAAALHERPRQEAIAGIALVIAGGLVVTWSGRAAARADRANANPSRT